MARCKGKNNKNLVSFYDTESHDHQVNYTAHENAIFTRYRITCGWLPFYLYRHQALTLDFVSRILPI